MGAEALGLMDWPRLIREQKWPAMPNGPDFTIVDLFAGCGGLTLGATLAACMAGRRPSIRLAVDNWMPATDAYAHNFGRIAEEILCADVVSVLDRDIPSLDLLVAGPPCQGHSDLNNLTRRRDPRNELYLAPAEFAAKNRPQVVVIENVPSVVHSAQNVVGRARCRLHSAGYGCSERVFDTSELGIPQRRRRHLLVGVRGQDDEWVSDRLETLATTAQVPAVMPFLEDLQDQIDERDPMFATTRLSSENKARISHLFKHDVYDLPDQLRPPCHRDKPHSYGSMYGRMRPDLPAQTITSGFGSMGQGRFVHPTRPRMITAREAARLQGFPDYFTFGAGSSRTALREMIANAVPPALSAAVVMAVLAE